MYGLSRVLSLLFRLPFLCPPLIPHPDPPPFCTCNAQMGQGLSTKVAQAAAYELSRVLPEVERPLPLDLIRLAPSSRCRFSSLFQTFSFGVGFWGWSRSSHCRLFRLANSSIMRLVTRRHFVTTPQ